MIRHKDSKKRRASGGLLAAAITACLLCLPAAAQAQPRAGANYQIPADVLSGGGEPTGSPNYINDSSLAQAGIAGGASVSAFGEEASHGFWPVVPCHTPDSDGDGIGDGCDNCILVKNPGQQDTDGDGYGNMCDGDFNGDNSTNSLDLGAFRQRFMTSDPDADFNSDGTVNSLDLGLFRGMFMKAPGPSAFAP